MAQASAIIGFGWRFVWAGTCSAVAMRYRFGRSHLLQYAPGMTTTGYIISWLLAAGVPGFFVYQMWTLRGPKCGYWSLSFPRSGFKQTGHHYDRLERLIQSVDEDGYLILECKKCQFRKRGAHKDEGHHHGGGGGDF